MKKLELIISLLLLSICLLTGCQNVDRNKAISKEVSLSNTVSDTILPRQILIKGVSLEEKACNFVKKLEPSKRVIENDISPEIKALMLDKCEFAGLSNWTFEVRYLKLTKEIISLTINSTEVWNSDYILMKNTFDEKYGISENGHYQVPPYTITIRNEEITKYDNRGIPYIYVNGNHPVIIYLTYFNTEVGEKEKTLRIERKNQEDKKKHSDIYNDI